MGRKSLKKDRGYITTTEWAAEWGGHKAKGAAPFKQLPFFCCAIAFTPFEDPACTADGTVYDLTNILPYIRKFHKHPVTGESLSLKDIIPLKYHRNVEKQYHCPVLNKVFTAHTHIVAIRPSGNVYCWEDRVPITQAIEELNIKQKYWKDLLTDEPFTRKDIIHLQDPLNLTGKNVADFDHVKHDRVVEEAEGGEGTAPTNLNSEGMSEDMQRMLHKLHGPDATEAFERGGGGKIAEASRIRAEQQAKAAAEARKKSNGEASTSQSAAVAPGGKDPRLQPPSLAERAPQFKPGAATWNTDDPSQAAPWVRAKMQKEMEAGSWRGKSKEDGQGAGSFKPSVLAQYREDTMRTTGEPRMLAGDASRSLTSSAVTLSTRNQRQMVRVERNPKKKGYLRLHTTLGDLNLELHCDMVPRTCENFIALADSGYYGGTVFHRSIKNFMLQGGDPSGTGTGGESIYGPTFRDEVDSRLLHSGRGVLSMANSGPNTNGSQFFVLYKSAHHLDYKHSVFGKVVGGLEVLTAMERVPTDDEDHPTEAIKITGVTIFVNPFREMEEAEKKQAEEEREKAEKAAGREDEESGTWFSNPSMGGGQAAVGAGVGKYLATATRQKAVPEAPPGEVQPKKKLKASGGFGNFDAW